MIQQDNARPHINDDDPDFRVAATQHGFNMRLVFQPPNSPDTNVNDLGFFRAIQSLQVQTAAKNVTELLNAVFSAYEEMSHSTLNNVFLSLQSCMVEIMKVRGHNNYKVPHMHKSVLLREGRLPTNIEVDEMLVKDCIEDLVQSGNTEGLEELVGQLMEEQ